MSKAFLAPIAKYLAAEGGGYFANKFAQGFKRGYYGSRKFSQKSYRSYRGKPGRRRFKRRKFTRNRRRRSAVSKLRKEVRACTRKAKSSLCTYTFKSFKTEYHTVADNGQNGANISVNDLTEIQSAIDNAPYFNTAVPNTYDFVDLTTVAKVVDINFKSAYSQIIMKNNYTTPVEFSLYACVPKSDTSITPVGAVDNALADKTTGPLTIDSFGVSPFDSPQFKSLWKIVNHKKGILKNGQEFKMGNNLGRFTYDASLTDSHPMTYQQRYKAMVYMFVIRGALGHDNTVAGEVSRAKCGVDVETFTRYVFEYDAGAEIEWLEVVNGSDTVTNAAITGQLTTPETSAFNIA